MGREAKINIAAFILAGTIFVGISMPAAASYLPFNTNVNMNVGIGTSTPKGAFVVMNGNVGIGTWIPNGSLEIEGGNLLVGYNSNPNNYQLDINGTAYAASMMVNPGSAAFPTFLFGTGDPHTGFFSSTTGLLQFTTNSTERMRIDSNGNVGIGSTAPGQALDVNGTVRMTGLTLTGNGAGNGNVLVSNSVGIGTWMTASSLGTLIGSNYWLNDTAGNVGISTTYAVGIGTSFVGGTGEAALSVMNGNVGIGTWLPVTQLELNQNNLATTSTDAFVLSNYTPGTVGTPYQYSPRIRFHGSEYNGGNHTVDFKIEEQATVNEGNLVFASSTDGGAYNNNLFLDNFGGVNVQGVFSSTNEMNAASNFSGKVPITIIAAPNQTADLTDWENSGGAIVDVVAAAGNVGIGTITAINQFVVNGAVGIGTSNSSYVTTLAPAGGMIVQGNVGIGTLHPGQALDVQGTVRMTGITLTGNGAGNGNVLVSNSVGIGTWMAASALGTLVGSNYWINDTAGNVGISTTYAVGIGTTFIGGTGEAALSIMNGNVGIGTWVPGEQLSVAGEIFAGNTTNNIVINPFSNPATIISSTNWLQLGDGGTEFTIEGGSEQAIIASTGFSFTGANVGIGSTVPGQALDVTGTVRTIGFTMSGQTPISGYVLTAQDSAGDATWLSPGAVGGWTVSGSNVYETSGGNVGIGTNLLTTAALSVMNGNVGIGTWIPGSALSIMNGNVGIGTNSPGVALGVSGSATIGSFNNKASGVDSIAMGAATTASGAESTSMGFDTTASNTYSTAMGSVTIASGSASTSMGQNTTASGPQATSMGNNTTASGNLSTSMGSFTTAAPYSSLVIGQYNYDPGTYTSGSWVPTEPVFIIGNGTSSSALSNAMTILKNGNVGIGTFSPNGKLIITGGNVGIGSLAPGQALDVMGTVRAIGLTMSGQTPISGYVLTAQDSGGDATWSSPGAVGGWTVSGNNVYETSGGNVGIGTINPFGGKLIVTGGNVGIGSLVPGQALDVQGTARMTGFTLSGNGAASGNVMVTNGVGVGTWMSTTTLPIATVAVETTGDVTYYNSSNGFAGGPGFQTNGTNVGIGTSNLANASLQVVGNIGIGTVSNGDNFINTLPPNGGMIIEGNVGIGTWAPKVTLDVKGNITAENGNVRAGGFGNFASGDTIVFNDGSSGINVETNSLSRMYVTLAGNVGIGTITPAGGLVVMNGNVGIGTATPTAYLDVNSPTAQNAFIVSANNGDVWRIDQFGNLIGPGPVIGFDTNVSAQSFTNSTATYITSGNGGATSYNIILKPSGSGNIGISSTTPGQLLDVAGTVRTIGLTMSGQTPISGYVLTSQDSAGDVSWSSPGTVSGWTVSGNNVYETSNGNVGIGTINPFGGNLIVNGGGNVGIGTLVPGQLLDVKGTVRDLGEIVNGNIGIGTSFVNGAGEGAVSVMNGNVGIGTWVPAGQLDVEGTLAVIYLKGNVGIGTATVPQYNLDLVNGTSRMRPVRRISTFAEGTTSATATINSNTTDVAEITFGNGAGITLTIANPSPSTPNDEDLLEIRVKDGGTAVTIAYGAGFASTTTTLPLTTVVSTWLRILFEYNSATSLWECVAST